jgi:hypothetical protein
LAYVNREGWARAKVLEAEYWTHASPREKIRIADGLRRQVLTLQPDWPGEEARAEDLAHHIALAAILARTARR